MIIIKNKVMVVNIDNNEKPKWWQVLIAVLVVSAMFMLTGCRSVRTVEVEKVRTEYKSKTDTLVQKDSIWCHDSIMSYIDGDTKYVDRWHTEYKDRYIYKVLQDTVYRTDTIPQIVEVERKSTLWEETKDDMFVPLLVVALFFGVIVLRRMR